MLYTLLCYLQYTLVEHIPTYVILLSVQVLSSAGYDDDVLLAIKSYM